MSRLTTAERARALTPVSTGSPMGSPTCSASGSRAASPLGVCPRQARRFVRVSYSSSILPTERPAAPLRLHVVDERLPRGLSRLSPGRSPGRLPRLARLAGLSSGHLGTLRRRIGPAGASLPTSHPRVPALIRATRGSRDRGQVRDFVASGRGTEDALAIVLSRHARAASWRAWSIVPQFLSSSALPISVGLSQMLRSRLLPARTCSR